MAPNLVIIQIIVIEEDSKRRRRGLYDYHTMTSGKPALVKFVKSINGNTFLQYGWQHCIGEVSEGGLEKKHQMQH